jgi:hypothetical protein
LTNFPVNGAGLVNSIAATGNGFVAVGTKSDIDTACLADMNQGRVWTSGDGLNWTSSADPTFAQTDLTAVVEFNGAVYALGFTGTFDTDTTSCANAPRPAGVNVWRSDDGGATWQQLTVSTALARASISRVIVTDAGMIAVGSDLDAGGNDQGQSWSSPDGVTWTPAELPPNAPHLATAVAKANVVVAFGDDQESPLAWISRDGGANWYEESIDIEGQDVAELSLAVEDVTATNDGYVAVGDGCCIGAAQLVPIVFLSADGTQWQGTPLAPDEAQAMRRVALLGNNLLAAGVETYMDFEENKDFIGGRSWTSTDGTEWVAGPQFPELGDGNVTALAVGSAGVVVAGTTFLDEPTPSGDTGLRIWFAPLSVFASAASN